LITGINEEPHPIEPITKKRGSKAKGKSLKLLEVFIERKEDVLRFMYNPIVPHDNNLAERDLRMIKLKQKYQAALRKTERAVVFCRTRSYVLSVKKQDISVFDTLTRAMEGQLIKLLPFTIEIYR